MNIGIKFFNLCFLSSLCSVDNFADSSFTVLSVPIWLGSCLSTLKNIILYEYFAHIGDFMKKVTKKTMTFDIIERKKKIKEILENTSIK